MLRAAINLERGGASRIWGISSVGRALHLQCRGQGFESLMLHWIKVMKFLRQSLEVVLYRSLSNNFGL